MQDRRTFIKRAAAGVVLSTGKSVETPARPAFCRHEKPRLPREVWVASVDLVGLHPETTVERRIERMLQRMEGVVACRPDILCLPETFSTSWVEEVRKATEWAEEVPGPLVSRIASFARINNCWVICPTLTRKEGRHYNSAVVLDRSGEVHGVFHKVRPTAGEVRDGVVPGPVAPPVFTTDFAKIGIQICYDANWIESWCSLKTQGAEIVFFPSEFPGGRILTSHAWMNQYYIVSSTGEDARIIDMSGDDLASSGPFQRWVCHPVNLEKVFIHIWPQVRKFDAVRSKYGRRLKIRIWHPENWATIESLDPELKVRDVLREFEMPTYEEQIADATAIQQTSRP
jgi:beta-ureidopropionase